MRVRLCIALGSMCWLLAGCETRGPITLRDVPPCAMSVTDGTPSIRVRPSGAYLDSLGVQLNLSGLPVLSDVDGIAADLRRIGARHVWIDADTVPRGNSLAGYRRLGDDGFRLLVGLYVGADAPQLLDALGAGVEGFQAPSPYDGASGSPPLADTRANLMLVASELAAARASGRVFVLGPDVFADSARVGDLTPWVDYGHAIASRTPGRLDEAERRRHDEDANYGDKPRFAMGGGAYATGGDNALPGSLQARYLARLYLAFFDVGIVRTYQPLYDGDVRAIGIYGPDGAAKPAAQLLGAMATLLDGARAATTTMLPIALRSADGTNGDLESVLLQNADGSFVLYYWWEINGDAAEQVKAATIQSAIPMSSIREHGLTGTAPPIEHADATSVAVVASDAPRALTFRIDCR